MSNNITDRFLLNNLDLDQRQLDHLLCFALSYKEAVTESIRAHGPDITLQLSDKNSWQFLKLQLPIQLEGPVAQLMMDRSVVSDIDITLLSIDEFPLGEFPLGEMPSPVWQTIDAETINLQTGVYDLSKFESKQYLCTFIAPRLMRLLQLSSADTPLWQHLRRIPSPMRAFLLYQVVKAKVSAKKQKAWRDFLADRVLQRLVHRNRVEVNRNRVEIQPEVDMTLARLVDESRSNAAKQAGLQAQFDELLTQQRSDQMRSAAEMARLEDAQTTDHGYIKEVQSEIKTHSAQIQTQAAQIKTHSAQIQTQAAQIQTQSAQIKTHSAQINSHAAQFEDMHLHTSQLLQEAVGSFTSALDQKFASLGDLSLRNAPAPKVLASPPALPLLFLRLRGSTSLQDDLVDHPIENPDVYRRIWVAEEENKIISRAVTANFTVPFVVALIGYSGGGKSYTAFGSDGLLGGILARLPNKTSLQVTQVLEKTKSLGSFSDQPVEEMAANITMRRVSARTAANPESSRAHIVIRFENPETDVPYGLLIDVAGPEESENIAQLDAEMTRESSKIAQDNIYIRQLLQEVVAGNDIALYKRSSKLNSLVGGFLKDAGTPTAVSVRVVVCAESTNLTRTLGMIPQF